MPILEKLQIRYIRFLIPNNCAVSSPSRKKKTVDAQSTAILPLERMSARGKKVRSLKITSPSHRPAHPSLQPFFTEGTKSGSSSSPAYLHARVTAKKKRKRAELKVVRSSISLSLSLSSRLVLRETKRDPKRSRTIVSAAAAPHPVSRARRRRSEAN